MRGSALSQYLTFLGAMCQIQDYILHLVTLACLPFRLTPFSHYTTERMINPYSGGPVCYMQIPSQQATIARLPILSVLLCAVQRRCFSVGVNPTRQLSLRPVATGAVVEATKRLKALV